MQGPRSFRGEKIWKLVSLRGMGSPAENTEVARRLIALRQLMAGDSQTAFAQQVGIDVKRWNNFERGLPLSKDAAIKLVRRIPGLTLDWLFLGVEDGMPTRLQRELLGTRAGPGKTTAPAGRGEADRP